MSYQSHERACYLCDSEWVDRRDESYYFDCLLIETFHYYYSAPIDTLEQLLNLINSYMVMKDSVVGVLTAHHTTQCSECEACGQKLRRAGKTPPKRSKIDPQSWDQAVEYYCGITENNRDILDRLTKCYPEMAAIGSMVGMASIKDKFVKLMKFLSTVSRDELDENSHLMHMVISGPPGHGKTEIAKLLGKAFRKSGLLKEDKFVIATRADLIGAYCGHTAINTTEMFDKAKGGVIFIDEVYALGNPRQKDVFTKECIDTINQLLSERSDTLCIIAGYEKEIQTCFFSYNQGLQRRFPWRFKIKQYTPEDLVAIFNKKLADMNWRAHAGALTANDIEEHEHAFQNAGGDIANLITSCMLAYYDNSFMGHTQVESDSDGADGAVAGTLSRSDILSGLDAYLSNKSDKRVESPPPAGMYS